MSEHEHCHPAMAGMGWLGRREILAVGGLTLIGTLPSVACAQVDVVPPTIIPMAIKDRFRAIQFRSALTRMEWITELMAAYKLPDMAPPTEKEDLTAIGKYYDSAWRAAEPNLGWAKDITGQRRGEISEFASQSLERFPGVRDDDRRAIADRLRAAGGAGAIAQERVSRLPEVVDSANEAIRRQQEKSGVPQIEDAKLRADLVCSLLGSQLAAAALAGQWQSQALLLVKMHLNRCL